MQCEWQQSRISGKTIKGLHSVTRDVNEACQLAALPMFLRTPPVEQQQPSIVADRHW